MAKEQKKGADKPKGLSDADKALVRDAFSHYGAEVKKLAKKSEALGLINEAEGFNDTLREIGVLFGKITGELELVDSKAGDSTEEEDD